MKNLISIIVICTVFIGTGLAQVDTYNLEVDLPKKYLEIQAGDTIFFTTKILNLANEQRKDIILQYSVTGTKEIYAKKETVAIETQASFVGSVTVPASTKKGKYQLEVSIVDETETKLSTAEKQFQVISAKSFGTILTDHWKLLTSILIAIILGAAIWSLRGRFKLYLAHRKISADVHKIITKKIAQGTTTKKELQTAQLKETKTQGKNEKKIY